MRIKPLSMLMMTSLLSAGLLLGGCSNNDTAESAGNDEALAENEEMAVVAEDYDAEANTATDQAADDETTIDSTNINPVTTDDEQPNLVTNPTTQTGTPEATVEQALNTLYYGDVKEAATYYEVDIANFEQELANTQSAFQQTVDSVTLIDTEYNEDKTRATINGELMLKGQSEPESLSYDLQKINGKWKILG